MSAKWLDLPEAILLIILGGFVCWPNGLSSVTLILLVAVQIYRTKTFFVLDLDDLLLLTPALVSGASWALAGFAPDGLREVQLWATLLASIVVFKHTNDRKTFVTGFIGFSILQAMALLAFFAFSDPFSTVGFGYHLRNVIEQTFHLHPTFLSTAWFWAAWLVLTQTRWQAVPRYGSFFLLTGMAALCGGRMPIIAFLVLMAVYMLLTGAKKAWQKPLGITGLLALGGVAFFSPVLHERFAEVGLFSPQYSEGEMLSSTQLRAGIWHCAFSTISENWATGVGTGNTRSALENCYATYHQVEFFEGEFNTHNQWLHFWLSSGVAGGLLFTLYCMWLMMMAVYTGNRPLLYFLVFYFLISLTENYFGRQFGMMFFSFFALTYWFARPHQGKTETSLPGTSPM